MNHMDEMSREFQALYVRSITRASVYATQKEAEEHHLDFIAMAEFDPEKVRETVQRERDLIRYGEQLFDAGWRIHSMPRQFRGLTHEIPSKATEWGIFDAGHIATTEATRVIYIVEPSTVTDR